MSILTGIFPPTSGDALINGYSVANQAKVRQSMGYCPQFSALFSRLTVRYKHTAHPSFFFVSWHKTIPMIPHTFKW